MQKNRNTIIKNLFSIIKEEYNYAILHHLDEVFNKKTDIDLVVGCNKKEFIELMKNMSNQLNMKIINFFTIDKNIYRLDFLFFDGKSYDTVELDCLLLGDGENLYKLDARYFLEDSKVVIFQEYDFNVATPSKEYEYYIKKKAYKNSDITVYYDYLQKLQPSKSTKDIDNLYNHWKNYFSSKTYKIKYILNKISLTYLRIFDKSSLTISFLGPDGSGKSTIIDKLFEQNIFRNKYYFHLKPLKSKQSVDNICEDPHKFKPYSSIKSYVKLIYFVFQYSYGWIKNISPLRLKSSLIVFDRYYDDIFADPKRYRFGGNLSVVKFIRNFIPQPEIYFILVADADIIYKRKQEVPFEELQRQITEYKNLADDKQYFILDASKIPDDITNDMLKIISEKMHEKY